MYEAFEEEVKRDHKTEQLYQRIESRIHKGTLQRNDLVEKVQKLLIRDRLVAPSRMQFVAYEDTPMKMMYLSTVEDKGDVVSLHPHALGQLCAKVGMPMQYAHRLNAPQTLWTRTELARHLTTVYHNTDFTDKRNSTAPRFLHRIVGNQLRGFLSRRFNRQLSSENLLLAFLQSCDQLGAQPIDAIATDIKFTMKCILPVIFEPVTGQPVCFGVEWSNSDFGAGRMQVALCVWAPTSDRFSVLDHTLSKVHIGSVLEDSDLEISEETASKEADAQESAINDAVRSQLRPESVKRLCHAIQLADQEEVPWHRLKGQLSKFLDKKDLDTLKNILDNEDTLVDLPPVKRAASGDRMPTKWWAISAMGWLANKVDDPLKRIELEHAAGSILDAFVKGA